MDLITIDFESYYDAEFSLSKLTTEEYIRSPEFEVIGVGVRVNNGDTWWASGTHHEIKEFLHSPEFNWGDSMVVAHNNNFDGAILSWVFDIHPKVLICTLAMAHALHGVEVGASLARLAKRYQLPDKGTEVVAAKGKRRADFTEAELDAYGDYCIHDVNLCYQLFRIFMDAGFPPAELRVIDMTIKMYTEPVFDLDLGRLEQHLITTKDRKDALLYNAGITDKKQLMSNPKFAELLLELGVAPPMKVSPTTDKETYAFAKSDDAFMALQEHEDDRVQALVAARLGNKSTLEETRTQRFIDISKRGLFPIPIKYYAAHTGRMGGWDKINLQNLPNRGINSKVLKQCVMAPPGYVIIDCDSSQIEARVLAWLAGQMDIVNAFANKDDVYKLMAMSIYDKSVDSITKEERFIGKQTILGAGYGMGHMRFQDQLSTNGVVLTAVECKQIISVYRRTNNKIKALWDQAGQMLQGMLSGSSEPLGKEGVLEVLGEQCAIKLPSGLLLRYDDLQCTESDTGVDITYSGRYGRKKIYGAKVIENVCQALARIVICEQALLIQKRYPIRLTVHDSLVVCVPEQEVEEARKFVEKCMRYVPDWAEGLPLDCESGVGYTYGECE